MMGTEAVITGIGETQKHRPSAESDSFPSLEEYYERAARLTLDDANVDKGEVDGLGVIRTITDTPFTYPGMLAETLGFEVDYLFSEDQGGANALAVLSQAVMAIEAGKVETVLCLGADAPLDPCVDSDALFPRDPRGYIRNYKDPFGVQGPNSSFGLVQTAHMTEYGTSREQLAEVAVVQREHASYNPNAYLTERIDAHTYLDSEMISDPVCLLDCVVPVNGGYGFLVTSRAQASTSDQTPVEPLGFGQQHNPDVSQRPDVTTTGIRTAATRAFDRAGVEVEQVDFVQAYDDYPIVVLMQLEDMGFCEKGDGGKFLETTDLRYDGELPLNTSGGQLSAGQAGLAGGFENLVEAVRQLHHDGGERQIPDAEYGLVTGVGGVTYDKNLRSSAVGVLKRGVQG
ncbi:thiolase family protein [halophilic archaeon]|nr:thiolase family protein [halophilic archaeon]